jgi:glucosamine--fructose-6-phosphate aminotransferase (isomerizing)
VCSVVGYIGKTYSRSFVLEGLARLEYRGYDSAGFACLSPDNSQLLYTKTAGKLSNLIEALEKKPIDGFIGIGHTRWSTHGLSSADNAHPHFDCHKTISVVHNGIIENHQKLRERLIKNGHIFHSQTDTEIIAHLFESYLHSHKTAQDAVLALVQQLEGAYAFLIVMEQQPDAILLVRKRSPLCIGIGVGEMFVASDMLAFAGRTNKVIFVPEESFAWVSQDQVQLYRFDGTPLAVVPQEMQLEWQRYEKQGHEHYMLKEIYEQKTAIADTVHSLQEISGVIWETMGVSAAVIKQLESINLLGCGTSWHAGYIAQFFFEEIALLKAQLHLASEFRYRSFFPEKHSLYMAISQSGETADTLEGMRLINSMALPTTALTNVSSSTMVRESDGFLLTHAGREIAVASTKAFSTQVSAFYWLAHRIAVEKGILPLSALTQAEHDLIVAAEILEETLENYKVTIFQTLAKTYAAFKSMIFLGRHISYPFAMEAALKLKEIAYIFTAAYPAGELKHGPLALIDEHMPVFVFSHQDPVVYQKLLSNVQEVKARKGHVVAFAFEGQHDLIALADTYFVITPLNPLLGPLCMTGLMQFFFYAIAKELGRPIDKPRNLAKSVTVE